MSRAQGIDGVDGTRPTTSGQPDMDLVPQPWESCMLTSTGNPIGWASEGQVTYLRIELPKKEI